MNIILTAKLLSCSVQTTATKLQLTTIKKQYIFQQKLSATGLFEHV